MQSAEGWEQMRSNNKLGPQRPRFNRVTRQCPCSICGREKYCMLSQMGDFALCTKAESEERIEILDGWQHFIPASERHLPSDIKRHTKSSNADNSLLDFSALHQSLIEAFIPTVRSQVADALGIHEPALEAFPLGWNPKHRALAIPAMKGPDQIVGIRYRRILTSATQTKWWCEHGSRWYPLLPTATVETNQPLFVSEGPSDCIAATHLGLSACGRWAKDLNQQTAQVILDHAKRVGASSIVVCGDNDASGGGEQAALQVAQLLKELSPNAAIKTIQPPVGIKDIREWVQCGATDRLVIESIKEFSE